jgi:hypothetical protein
MDISKTITPKSDQLNADDLIGKSMTIQIRDVKGNADDAQPVSIFFEGDNNKPYKPCKSMRRVLVQLWGGDGTKYIGRKLTLYRDDNVKFGGVEIGGIRISHASHIKEATKVILTVSKSARRPYTIEPIVGKKITDMASAKNAVKEGKYTIEKLQSMYEITEEELKELQS